MGVYLMMLYVTQEQEENLKAFFAFKGWDFLKPDLSQLTETVGSCTPSFVGKNNRKRTRKPSTTGDTGPLRKSPKKEGGRVSGGKFGPSTHLGQNTSMSYMPHDVVSALTSRQHLKTKVEEEGDSDDDYQDEDNTLDNKISTFDHSGATNVMPLSNMLAQRGSSSGNMVANRVPASESMVANRVQASELTVATQVLTAELMGETKTPISGRIIALRVPISGRKVATRIPTSGHMITTSLPTSGHTGMVATRIPTSGHMVATSVPTSASDQVIDQVSNEVEIRDSPPVSMSTHILRGPRCSIGTNLPAGTTTTTMAAVIECDSFEAAKNVIRNHELESNHRYASYTTTKNFGSVSLLSAKRVFWEDIKVIKLGRQDFTGVPFVILGKKTYDCQFGKDRKKKSKDRKKADKTVYHADNVKGKKFLIQTTKKLGCSAGCRLREIGRFPQYRIDADTPTSSRKQYSQEILRRIKSGDSIDFERVIVTCTPDPSEHTCHRSEDIPTEPLDPRLSTKIKELCEAGVTSLSEIRTQLHYFVREICNPLPHPCSSRFYPADRIISSHIYACKVEMKTNRTWKT